MEVDLSGSPPPCVKAVGSPLHHSEDEMDHQILKDSPLYYGNDEMELCNSLDQELRRRLSVNIFQVASTTSPLFEVEEEENYLEANLNSSILLSEKFELSIHSQDGNSPDVLGSREDAERFVDDLSEDEKEIEDSMGDNFLKKLDRDYVTSPRLIVRGVYKGDVLKLTVRRKTDGTYVNWFMVNSETKDIVLNVKAQMTYSFDIRGGMSTKYGRKVPGGWAWEGFGYGFVNVFPGANPKEDKTKILHVEIDEAILCSESILYHFEGDNCKREDLNVVCREPGCGVAIWKIMFKTFATVAKEQEYYELGCNLRKTKPEQKVYLTLIAFFSGEYKLLLHRDGEKSHVRVAWLTKDIAAPFEERPEVDLRKIEEARQIWEKPVEKQPVEDNYEEEADNRNIDEHEFAPEVSSTPVKANRSNRGVYAS